MRSLGVCVALGALAPALPCLAAATATCSPGYIKTGEELDRRINAAVQSVLDTQRASQALPKVELFKSIGPPTASEGSRLVDGASFTDVLAIAVENELIKGGADGQTAVQISPYAWFVAMDPNILNDADKYDKHKVSRRFALSFATGGKGEKFDRTGDGVADDPLASDDFNDIQTWELKYRFFGGGDWKENRGKLRDAADEPTLRAKLRANIALGLTPALNPGAGNCISGEIVDRYLDSTRTKTLLLELAEETLRTNVSYQDVMKSIASQWTGSVVAATTQQDPDFGQDKWSTGLRVSWGGDVRALNLNLDYSEANGRGALPDPNSWKVGAEYVRRLLPGKLGKKGVKTALSAVWEIFDDIPDAKHDDIGKIGVRFEIPIAGSDAVKLPISIIWANHEDVLTDSDSVRGHVGFTVDFGEALKKQKAE
jgi:hypothetical protein